MVTKIQNDDFSAVENSGAALVDFSATWCGPCGMLAPIVDQLSDDMAGSVSFFNVDTDDNPDISRDYLIQNIPTLILFKDGAEISRMVGFRQKDMLRSWIESELAK